MEHRSASENRPTHRMLSIAYATALVLALTGALAQPAHAKHVELPPMPADIQADAANRAYLGGHAVGTQNYICLPSGSTFAWSLFTPEATLFNDDQKQLVTHFFSPNPFEPDLVRATWQHSKDSSVVWAKLKTPSSDPAYVAPGAIPWLLLDVAGAAAGPDGGDTLSRAVQIQRLNTLGGAAPSTGCAASTDVGKRAFVPYSADYIFYLKRDRD